MSSNSNITINKVIHSYLKLRLYFSDKMYTSDGELFNLKNYSIHAKNIPNKIIEIFEIFNDSKNPYPSYIDLNVSDCINGEVYILSIIPNTVRCITSIGAPGQFIINGNNTYEFIGVSIRPEIISISALNIGCVRVVFSKCMKSNDDLVNPKMYKFTYGLQVLRVRVESESSVILFTTPQIKSQVYELTIGNGR